MRRAIIAAALLATSPAFAQAPPGAPAVPAAPPSLEQLVKDRLGQDGLTILACQAGSAALKAQLDQAQARIRDLEAAAKPAEAPKTP